MVAPVSQIPAQEPPRAGEESQRPQIDWRKYKPVKVGDKYYLSVQRNQIQNATKGDYGTYTLDGIAFNEYKNNGQSLFLSEAEIPQELVLDYNNYKTTLLEEETLNQMEQTDNGNWGIISDTEKGRHILNLWNCFGVGDGLNRAWHNGVEDIYSPIENSLLADDPTNLSNKPTGAEYAKAGLLGVLDIPKAIIQNPVKSAVGFGIFKGLACIPYAGPIIVGCLAVAGALAGGFEIARGLIKLNGSDKRTKKQGMREVVRGGLMTALSVMTLGAIGKSCISANAAKTGAIARTKIRTGETEVKISTNPPNPGTIQKKSFMNTNELTAPFKGSPKADIKNIDKVTSFKDLGKDITIQDLQAATDKAIATGFDATGTKPHTWAKAVFERNSILKTVKHAKKTATENDLPALQALEADLNATKLVTLKGSTLFRKATWTVAGGQPGTQLPVMTAYYSKPTAAQYDKAREAAKKKIKADEEGQAKISPTTPKNSEGIETYDASALGI